MRAPTLASRAGRPTSGLPAFAEGRQDRRFPERSVSRETRQESWPRIAPDPRPFQAAVTLARSPAGAFPAGRRSRCSGTRQAARTSPRTPRQPAVHPQYVAPRDALRCSIRRNTRTSGGSRFGWPVSQSIRLNGGAKENPFPNNQSEASSFRRSSRTSLSLYQTNVLERSLITSLFNHFTSHIN